MKGLTSFILKPVKFKTTDPVKGELYEPLVVIPPVTFNPFDPLYIKGDKDKEVEISVTGNKPITIAAITGKTAAAGSDTVSKMIGGFSLGKRSIHTETFKDEDLDVHTYRLTTTPDEGSTGLILRTIGYEHIPTINYFKDALLTVKKIDAKIYGKKIGYIVGAGDKVPEALEQMGFDVTMLADKELSRINLNQFDAIIAGVRAYNTDEWLNNYYDKLMKYVNDGGNLIVQYNTSSNIGPVRAKIAPYTFDISRTRVTDENADVTILKPDHPVLNFPNKIGPDDFKGWIQERSIYHAAAWDKTKFETIFSMHDPGEAADEGSLIIAKYGKGIFVYTGLVFFRQLPAGVPGAYRLMANIIALNKKKAF